MKKVYQKKDQFSNISSMRIDVSGQSKTIAFENKRKNGVLVFETTDEEVQKGIESCKAYQEGRIICIEGATANKTKQLTPPPPDDELTELPEVTTFAEAKAVLRGEPYNVGATSNSLKSAEGVIAKAAELGISFPNLKIDEE